MKCKMQNDVTCDVYHMHKIMQIASNTQNIQKFTQIYTDYTEPQPCIKTKGAYNQGKKEVGDRHTSLPWHVPSNDQWEASTTAKTNGGAQHKSRDSLHLYNLGNKCSVKCKACARDMKWELW